MDSPAQEQQETQTTEDLIAAEFDRQEADESLTEEIEDAEVEVSTEADEEVLETVAEGTEGVQEQEEEVVAEAVEQVKEEIAEAADSDYQEPAPERWPEDIKKVYNELPPVARKAMLEGIYKPMQRQYTQSTQQLAKQRGLVDPILKGLNQYGSVFQQKGISPVEAVTTQMAWAAHFAAVGPEQAISDLRAAHGLDKQTTGQTEQYLTPVERAMQDKIDNLSTLVQGQQQETALQKQEREIADQNATKQAIESTVAQFKAEQLDGQPAHPYVEQVAPAMAGLIKGGLVRSQDEYGAPIPLAAQIADAYSQACNLDATIRNKQPVQRQVTLAKAAQNVGKVTNHPTSKPADKDMPITDFIENTYDRLAKRG